MKHWYQQPHQLLSEYVKTVLILEGFTESGSGDLPLVTIGMSALFCKTEKDDFGNEKIIQLALFGKSVPEEHCEAGINTTIIAYFFKPFALASIFNVTAAKVLESPVELINWSPHNANALQTQLIYAGSTTRKIEVLDNLLIHQLQQHQRECEIIRYATDQVMYNPGTEILSEILSKLNLNERTFQRLFKKYVGVTASQYRRICQFQVSFSQLRSNEFNKLTDVAYDNGFADQSHFIRSFREFTQTTPNDYLKSGLKDKK